ncbi:hypothetical protein NLG97_g3358 [Lecanicillium saksenae]|uniref:Uncharacterized protein n=1 Tax=Lecanicillium saksenae TaxID=468837 RepID=A0ACC1QYA6_9HYPO|nr:hypothetical protein NLG97_g3358 [Lecanicillium saksenae]
MPTFDFIVVGSGPAGSLLASRLAGAASKPSVLLLEAGGDQPDSRSLSLENRWTLFQTKPDINWGYKSTSEPKLNGRSLDISRGKALGGTSNINFTYWTPPNKDAIEEFQARVGGDAFFSWENSQRLLDGIVKYRVHNLLNDASHPLQYTTDHSVDEYVELPPRGGYGPFEAEWTSNVKKGDVTLLKGAVEHGFRQNRNMNSGDSLGIGLTPSSASEATYRRTASSAFLADRPANLTVKTGLEVSRIRFEGKTAKAVEVNGGVEVFEANRCVVLSAGSINTPKLLMLSGVGAANQLATNNIPLVSNLPAVGQNLKDHYAIFLSWKVDNDFAGAPVIPSITPAPNQDMVNAVVAFDRDGAMVRQPGFKKLVKEEQRLLLRKDTPTLEIAAVTNWPPIPEVTESNVILALFHLLPQSTGSVTLASSDWRDAPNINLDFYSDEGNLDMAAAISYVRKGISLIEKTDSLSRHVIAPIQRPNSDSEEDIVAFLREHTNTVWHPSCTSKMGPMEDDGNSVVDPSFKVRNLDNLRVVDLSVAPVIPNYHPVSMVLLLGAWAAERMINEYNL